MTTVSEIKIDAKMVKQLRDMTMAPQFLAGRARPIHSWFRQLRFRPGEVLRRALDQVTDPQTDIPSACRLAQEELITGSESGHVVTGRAAFPAFAQAVSMAITALKLLIAL